MADKKTTSYILEGDVVYEIEQVKTQYEGDIEIDILKKQEELEILDAEIKELKAIKKELDKEVI